MVIKRAKRALCTALALTVGISAAAFRPMETEAAFEKNAVQTVADMGFGWNLGNSLDSYSGTVIGSNIGSTSSETVWGNPATTKAMIDMVKKSGVKTVRVPVTWYEHMNPNTYEIDQVWMDRVEEVVNYVLDDDMYCIINVHHDTGEKGWLKANSTNLDQKKKMFTAIWEQVSENFADYGDKLLFEGYNEILDESDNRWWNPSSEACPISNDLNQIFVDTVRQSGGHNAQRNLICNTYCAGSNDEITRQFVLPDDTVSGRLIVQTHVYQPFDFTYEGAPDVTTWTSTTLDMVLNNIYSTFVQKGIPVIVGEFGCAKKNNMDQIISWAKYLVESCTEKGIRCIWWDNGDLYKIYNRNTMTVSEPDLLGTMLAAAGGGSYEVDTTLYGDADNNGVLEMKDLELLQAYQVGKVDSVSNCDMNKDNVVDVFDVCILRNLFLQGDNMCSSMDNWSSWIDTANGADGDVTYTSNGVTVDVRNGGTNVWDAQVAYKNLTIEQGATYKLSFDYSSTVAQTMDCHVMQNHDDYIPYYSVNLDYTTEKQHHESTFTMTSATDKNTQISFNCGGSSLIPCIIEISNLSLVKISDGTSSDDPGNTDDPVIEDGENLCDDSSNWGGWVYEDEAAAEVKTISNGITIDVTNTGSEEWHIQGSFSNLTLTKGVTYRVEFDYSATKDVPLGFHVQQNYDPYGQYHYESVNCTTSVQHYSAEFTMTDTDDNVVCVFNCGGVSTAVPFSVTVENLSLVQIS